MQTYTTLVIFVQCVWCLSAGLVTLNNEPFSGVNIALHSKADQSPDTYCSENVCYNASLAVDGIADDGDFLKGHCSQSDDNNTGGASWNVEFGRFYYITGVKIYNRQPAGTVGIGARLKDFSLFATRAGNHTDELLHQDSHYQLYRLYQIDIPLRVPLYVSGIRIQIPDSASESVILTLCEVQAFSGPGCVEFDRNKITVLSYTDDFNAGSIATVYCAQDSNLSRAYIVYCNGQNWDGHLPQCEEVQEKIKLVSEAGCSPGKIVGITVGVSVAVIIACAIIYLIVKRKRSCEHAYIKYRPIKANRGANSASTTFRMGDLAGELEEDYSEEDRNVKESKKFTKSEDANDDMTSIEEFNLLRDNI